MIWLAGAAALCWLTVLLLPWQPWRLREHIEADRGPTDRGPTERGPTERGPTDRGPDPLSDVRILIPARNEAELLGGTLAAALAQGSGVTVVVIDDQSEDATAVIARAAGPRVHVVPGAPRPAGWSGKLWALQQGHSQQRRPFTLLIDADIRLAPGTVQALRNQWQQQGDGLVSVMATLRMTTFWEQLLLPAFIYFFRLLYPFSLVNRRRTRVAAAAGGCVFLPTTLIDELNLFRRVGRELIDDCALAREVKASGRPLWLGVSRSVSSARPAADLSTLAAMVHRTAFTQLGNSATVLLMCTGLMMLAFAVPPLAVAGGGLSSVLGLLAWGAMSLSYLPTLHFYDRAPAWALLLPAIGLLYLLFTWQSARSAWKGERARWRGRTYATGTDS